MRRNVNVPAPADPLRRVRLGDSRVRGPRSRNDGSSARRRRPRAGGDRRRGGRPPTSLDSELAQAATDRARRGGHARRRHARAAGRCPRARSSSRRRSRRPSSAAWPGVRLTTSIDDPEFQVPADPALVTQALAGAIDALSAFVDDPAGAITLSVHCVKTRPAMIIELAQRVVSVEPELMGQFFDVDVDGPPRRRRRQPSCWRRGSEDRAGAWRAGGCPARRSRRLHGDLRAAAVDGPARGVRPKS